MTDASSALEMLRWASIALYVAAAIGAVFWAYRRPSPVRTRTTGVVAALVLLGLFPGSHALRAMEQQRSRAEIEKYREAAWAHFRKRCKENAGERIYGTAKDVKGFFLERPRKKPSEAQLRDQYWLGDPYGLVLYPPAQISGYLRDLDDKDLPTLKSTAHLGYRFVETPSPSEKSKVLRYYIDRTSGRIVSRSDTDRRSRYMVSWRDISTKRDRMYWVAGGRLLITDTSTGRLLGERVGYVFETGFGSTTGGRRPWLVAQHTACPPIRINAPMDRLFVEKVLKPSRHEHRTK